MLMDDDTSKDEKERFISASVGPSFGMKVLRSNFSTLFRESTSKPTIESTFKSKLATPILTEDKRKSLNPIRVLKGEPALVMSPVHQATGTLSKPKIGSHNNLKELKHKHAVSSTLNPNRISAAMKKSPSLNECQSKNSLNLDMKDQRLSALSLEERFFKEQRRSALSLEDMGDQRNSVLSFEETMCRLSTGSDMGYFSTSPGANSPKHRSVVDTSSLKALSISDENCKIKKQVELTPTTAKLFIYMDSNQFSPLHSLETSPKREVILDYLDLSSTSIDKLINEKEEQYKKRYNLILELLNTEITYVNGLKLIDSCFYQPLIRHPSIWFSKKLISDIFSNFKDILNVNTELLKQLINRIKPNFQDANMDGDTDQMPLATELKMDLYNDKIGDIFRMLGPFLKMYSIYVKNFPSTLTMLNNKAQPNKYVNRPEELKQVKQVWNKESSLLKLKGLSVESYLILPVQRIPRYQMLLEQLVQQTPANHSDYKDLKEALKLVKEVAIFVNEMIRFTEMTMKILDIQKRLISLDKPLLQPGRILIKSGKVNKISRKSHDQRQFHLFNDMLLVCTPINSLNWNKNEEMYKINRMLDLNSIIVQDCLDQDFVDKNNICIKNGIQLIHTEKSFTFYLDNVKEKIEWLNLIKKTKEELEVSQSTLRPVESNVNDSSFFGSVNSSAYLADNSSEISFSTINSSILSPKFSHGSLALDQKYKAQLEAIIGAQTQNSSEIKIINNYKAPIWVPDDQVQECLICNLEFGLFKRKHHCRLCGKIVCNTCSDNSFLILNASNTRVARGCNNCFIERNWAIQDPANEGLVNQLKRYSLLSPSSPLDSLDSSFNTVTSANTVASAVPKRLTKNSTIKDLADKSLRNIRSNGELTRPSSILQSNEIKNCELCMQDFGLFSWRHSCSICFRSVCIQCISKKSEEGTEVCDPCSLGVAPGSVRILENGGGWSVLE